MNTLQKVLLIPGCLLASAMVFSVQAQEKLKVGVDTAFVPFEFKQEGKYVGFDIDLWDAIAKKMQIEYQLKPMDFNGLIPALQAKNLDVAMAGINITPERSQVVDFSEGYYEADILMAVKSTDNSTHKFSDLTGKRVGIKLGTVGASYMKSNIKADYREFPNIDTAYLDLQAGHLDAVVHDSPNILYYVKTAGEGNIKAVGENDSILPQKYGFALQKNSQYVAEINKAIDELKKDGTYKEIYKKWFDKYPKQ